MLRFPVVVATRLRTCNGSMRMMCSSFNSGYSDVDPLDSVVKVFTNISSPNYRQPWQNKTQREVSGSAFVVSTEPGRILTNAHVVANHKLISVRRHGLSTKFVAKVESISHESDLALLSVDDLSFWSDISPLPIDPNPSPMDIPELDSEVAVVGYPTGGDNVSVTRGVVSRVELQRYAHSGSDLLAIQIDAAVNPGNSGGPAIQGENVVGLAFQNLAGAENIGFIIPVPVIKHFLKSVSLPDNGFGGIGLELQTLANPTARKFLSIPDERDVGVRVTKIDKLSNAKGKLNVNDVILEIDGNSVASDGTIEFRRKQRISFRYLMTHKFIGDSVDVKAWRPSSKEIIQTTIPLLSAVKNSLCPPFEFDVQPSYHIWSGFVFVRLSAPYLYEFGEEWYNNVPRKMIELTFDHPKSLPDEEVVIISQTLVHRINAGYENMTNLRVMKVNGESILNLKHLKSCLDKASESSNEYTEILMDDGFIIAIKTSDAIESNSEILKQHRIAVPTSEDL